MYVVIDTSAPGNLDTVSKSVFKYDNLKRLIKYEYVSYTNGVFIPAQSYRLWNAYFYNGTDTLPAQEIDSVNELSSVGRTNTYYKYANGRLITDSTVRLGTSSDEVHNYYYLPNKIVDTFSLYDKTTTPFTRSYVSYKNVFRQTQNNNVISNTDSLYDNISFTPPPTFTYLETQKTTNTFDNNKNPFYKFSSLDPFLNNYNSIFEAFPFSKQSKSNTTQFSLDVTGSNSFMVRFRFSYQYKANGFPTIVRAADLDDPTTFFKGFYFYTN